MRLMTLAVCATTVVGLVAGLAAEAGAAEARVGDLVISEAWARASPGVARNGVAYLTITNHAEQADRLVAVSSARAERAELHTHLMEDEVMKMRPVEAVDLPPGEATVLQPGGNHIMLIGLASPLQEGEAFELGLVFEHAGRVTVTADVAGYGAMGPPSGHMD